jgi:hypothetical protein
MSMERSIEPHSIANSLGRRVDASEAIKDKGGSDFEKRRRAKMRMKKASGTPWTIDERQRREMK